MKKFNEDFNSKMTALNNMSKGTGSGLLGNRMGMDYKFPGMLPQRNTFDSLLSKL